MLTSAEDMFHGDIDLICLLIRSAVTGPGQLSPFNWKNTGAISFSEWTLSGLLASMSLHLGSVGYAGERKKWVAADPCLFASCNFMLHVTT